MSFLKLVVRRIILLIFIVNVNCLSNANSCRENENYNETECWLVRTELVNELYNLKESILESVNDQEKTQFILKRLKDIWPTIENISITLFHSNSDSGDQLLKQEKELKNFTAHLLFIAKARHCESPDETFYKPMNQCLPVGSLESCPKNMVLNDGPGNEGYCDCSLVSPPYLVYSNQSGKCFPLNSLGPCHDGEWFEINENGKPECQPAPGGCPVDGQHVYWSDSPEEPKKCWKLFTSEACGPSRRNFLWRDSELRIKCMSRRLSFIGRAPHSKQPCKPGSYRNQNLKCTPPFF